MTFSFGFNILPSAYALTVVAPERQPVEHADETVDASEAADPDEVAGTDGATDPDDETSGDEPVDLDEAAADEESAGADGETADDEGAGGTEAGVDEAADGGEDADSDGAADGDEGVDGGPADGEDAKTEADDESDADAESQEEPPPVLGAGQLSFEGPDYTVTLSFDETARIPEGSTVRSFELVGDEYDAYFARAQEAMPDVVLTGARFFDIEIVDPNGATFEPLGPVQVTIAYADADLAAASEAKVVHFDDGAAEAATTDALDAGAAAEAEPVVDVISGTDSDLTGDVGPDVEEDDAPSIDFAAAPVGDQVLDAVVQTLEQPAKAADEAAPTAEVSFVTESFSVFGVVYTVDFSYVVNGKTFQFSLPGGGFVSFADLVEALGIINDIDTDENEADDTAEDVAVVEDHDVEAAPLLLDDVSVTEATRKFVADVQSVEFSSPELVWVGKVDSASTVGELKEANGLECECSAELTEEQIAEVDAQTVEAGDWAVISMHPFDTEECLIVTMRNGEVFTIEVTDAHEIPDASAETIDVNKSYLICYEVDGQYYLLKNDGSVDNTHTPATFENLNSTYCWTFNYVFEEKHLEETLTYIYYLIRPIDNKTKTIALNAEGQPLVQRSNNNVAVIPTEGGGFKLIGYNNIRLDFDTDSGQFIATEFPENNPSDGITVHIWEMDSLPTYSYAAYSADEIRGSVSVAGGTAKTEDIVNDQGEIVHTVHYYEAESNSDKMNAGAISAIPVNHPDGQGDNKWLFDHWTQDGIPLDRDVYPATISAESLPIPFNGSTLVAHFKQNPAYDVPDNEKEPSSFEDLQEWIDSLSSNPVPIDNEETTKTAEVYDYENRIYRVDIASKSNFKTFKGNVDMAFCMDVSNSMYFPSALVETTSADHANPMPIYQINNSGRYWSNQGWLDTSRGWNNPYYLIADQSNTATVFRVYYQDGNWKAQDASRETESEKSFIIGQPFETTWTDGISDKTHPFNAGDDNNTTYTIYDAGDDGRNRFYYLNQAFSGALTDLTTIEGILAVAGDESPEVFVAYNTFNKELGSQRHDFQLVDHVPRNLDLSNSHGGGTRPDQAFNDAKDNFTWLGEDRYVVLITDGAPQGKRTGESLTPEQIVQAARDAAEELQKGQDGIKGTADDVKIITVGLSLDKVPSGKKLLYDIADTDKNGDKMFFLAESASDLPNILRQVIKTIMDDAVVMADVTDTVGEAFYAVDKTTGLPLANGDMIDIEGRLTADPEQAAGIVSVEDGITTVTWLDQAIDSSVGWHGTLYVKAKEDFLGGNAMETNDDAHIEATKYRMGDNEYEFNESLIGDKLKSLEVEFASPRVNVNELTFPSVDTEWTVYLGTEVDPKAQLKKLYESIFVERVVNEDGSLHYALAPNNIADNRENQVVGEASTLNMADVILECIQATAGTDNDLAALYVQDGELNWDAFLTAILTPDGVAVPYHLFGAEGEDSSITIKLTKQIMDGEEQDLVGHSPHETTVVNDGETPAEKYTLVIRYDPDYDHVLPEGQGGHGYYDYSTGTYGAMYQGHAAGRETSTIGHTVNVYNVPLDVYKTDGSNLPLAGATFKLYKEDEENGVAVAGLDGTKTYIEVATATSENNGIARLKHDGEDFGLVLGETYYLVESAAPANYTKVNTVWAVEVQTEIGKFTDLDGETIYSEATPPPSVGSGVTNGMYPFNWDQGARIVLDGSQPVTMIAKGETEGSTTTITDGSFVSHDKAISFRHTVLNLAGGLVTIDVNKTWQDENDPPDSITVKLYRASEKGHQWGNGIIVPCTCTDEGVEEYTCSECGKKDTRVISAADHTPGAAHRENEEAPTCTVAGGYDTVVRCTVCNAIISSEHTEIPAMGHTWVEQDTATSDPDQYCYDTANICTKCGAIDDDTRLHHVHDWGEWEVTTPAQPGVPGLETRHCTHDPSHMETQEIPALPNEHTVSIYFRCIGDGNGNYNPYAPSTTELAFRSGTGAGDMTIQWDWNQWTEVQQFLIDGLGESTYSTYSTTDGREYNRRYENGRWVERGMRQTLTIHNITRDLTLYVTIRNGGYGGTNGSLIYQPTFAGVQTNNAPSPTQGRRSAPTEPHQMLAQSRDEQFSTDSIVLRGGEGGRASSITQAQLLEYLGSLKPKADATCSEDAETHIYVEEVPGTYTLSKDDGWSLAIGDLPKYNEYGNEYTYYVVEDPALEGFEVTYAGQGDGLHDQDEVTINNRLQKGSLKITKNVSVPEGLNAGLADGTYTFEIWTADGSSQITKKDDGSDIGPLMITIADGAASPAELSVDTLTAGNYLVKETASTNSAVMIDESVSGYDAVLGGIVVTVTAGDTLVPTAAFTNKYETTSATVKKVWDDDGSSSRPSSLTVTLVADGVVTDQTVTLSSDNGWQDTVASLPKYKDGVEIDYHWLEGAMPDGYFLTNVAKEGTITTLTNTLSTYDLKTSYTGIKTWDDEDNKYSTRPHELIVTLYADGVAQTLEPVWNYDHATNQWAYTFDNLPVFSDNGTLIHYTVQETVPAGYTKTDESSTPTTGQFGTITYENGTDRTTPDNQIVWNLGSLIDLSFIAIKPTANGDVVVWTHRTPVPAERTAITDAIQIDGALPGCSGRNIVFYSGTGDVQTPHGSVHVTYDQANLSVTLDFGSTDVWSQFIVGQFNQNNSSSYNIGTTAFTNELETTSLSGTKTWIIEGEEIPADPILTLTRTVTTTEGEGDEAVTTTSTPEVVKVMQGETQANLQPEWSGTGKNRSFSYTGLPKYDSQGNEYTYSVTEASFTVGSGDDAVTYTAVRAADGSYTVTADKPDAPIFTVVQTNNDITNGLVKATIEIIKVEKGYKDNDHSLSGAKFRLTRVNEYNDNNYEGDGAYQSDIQTVDAQTGATTFTGLMPGRFKLEEIEAPAGYVLVESPWFFIIDDTGSAELQASYNYTLASAVDGKDNSFWIENTPGAALPSTGGPGTNAIYLLGIALIGLAGAGYAVMRRRKAA